MLHKLRAINLKVCSLQEYWGNVVKRKTREPSEKNAATGRNGYVPQWQSQSTNFHSLCGHVLRWALAGDRQCIQSGYTFQGEFCRGAEHQDVQDVGKHSGEVQCAGLVTVRQHAPLRVRVHLNQLAWRLSAEQNTSMWAKLKWPCVQRTQEDKHFNQPFFLLPIACPRDQSQLEIQLQGEGTIAVVRTGIFIAGWEG